MARGISETDRGMLATSMSDASVAMMLGRSVAWVVRTRQAMREPEPATAPAEEAPAPAPVEIVIAPGPAELAALSVDDQPVEITPALRAQVKATGTAKLAPAIGRRPATERRPAAQLAASPAAVRIEILKPVTPRIVGWARRFRSAGWDMAEVAGLFDVDAEALGLALEGGRA